MIATATRKELSGLRREMEWFRATRARTPLLRRLKEDPSRLMAEAGMPPDSWQRDLLRSYSDRVLMLITRQGGKSLTAAALALREALFRPPALVLLLSPTLRQSGELFRDKVRRLYGALGRPVACSQETALTMELVNGSRIISLPGEEETIRGYSGVRLLIIDEAARVDDGLYYSVRPMLATSRGKLVALSTPFGRRGWFYEAWCGSAPWHRVSVPATACPRIAADFLEEERLSLGQHWYSQEYLLEFRETTEAFFRQSDIDAMSDHTIRPLALG
jgi:hypothetical protein